MPNTLRGEKIPGGEYSKTLRGEKAPTFSRGRKFPGEIVPGGSKCQMTQGGECSRGSIVKNVEGGVYSRGENELSVRGGEAWYSGGRKCQGEKVSGGRKCVSHIAPTYFQTFIWTRDCSYRCSMSNLCFIFYPKDCKYALKFISL